MNYVRAVYCYQGYTLSVTPYLPPIILVCVMFSVWGVGVGVRREEKGLQQ